MFGKFKAIKGKVQKFLGKSLNQLDTGSKWLGKKIHQVEKGYRVGKSYIEHNADKLDEKFGTEGSFRHIANQGINAVERNPIVRNISKGMAEARIANKILRKTVLNNSQLKSFIGQ